MNNCNTPGDRALAPGSLEKTLNVELDHQRPQRAGANDRHLRTDHLLKNLRGRTISSGLITVLAQGIQFVMNLGSTMVLARLLTPRDFGLVAMVTTIFGFFRAFKDAGLSTATVQREGITHAQVSNLFWVNLGVSALISLLLAISAPAIAWFFREPRLIGITLALSVTFLLPGSTVQHMALLNRQMRFGAIAIIQVSSMVAGVAVGIGMALLNWGYWSLVGMNVTLAVAAFLLTWSACHWRPQLPRRRSGTRPLLQLGANLAAAGFTWSLARGSDGLLIGRFYGAGAVGLYSRAGLLLIRPVDQLLSPVGAVFLPVLSRLQTEPERYRRTFLQIYQGIVMACFLVTSLFLPLARPLTLVTLGAKWEAASPIFAAFTICALFYPLLCVTFWLFDTQGRGKDCLRSSLVVSGITVLSFLAGLPFGPLGVAIFYSVSGVLIQLPLLYQIAGRSGPVTTPDLWAGFLRFLPLWGLVAGATWLMTRTLAANCAPLAQLVICAPVGLLVGAGFIWVYPPARRNVASMIEALRDWKR